MPVLSGSAAKIVISGITNYVGRYSLRLTDATPQADLGYSLSGTTPKKPRILISDIMVFFKTDRTAFRNSASDSLFHY